MDTPLQSIDWSDHILLAVEDYDDNFSVIDVLLRRTNVVLLRATSVRECMEILAEYPEIRIILMDISLPGMSGIDALHLIREQYPDKTVIAQTAHSYSGQIAKESFDDFIQKPVRNEKILELLSKYLP